jgi:WD40 repeat protein
VAQLALQQPQTSVVLDLLQRAPLQRLVVWRNKPLADDPCVATFVHQSCVNAVAVSKTRIVGGAGKAVYVYDADSEELLKQLEGTSDVKSVAVFEDEQGGLITAGYEDGTIKVWDSGVPEPSNRPSLAEFDACWLVWQAHWSW